MYNAQVLKNGKSDLLSHV